MTDKVLEEDEVARKLVNQPEAELRSRWIGWIERRKSGVVYGDPSISDLVGGSGGGHSIIGGGDAGGGGVTGFVVGGSFTLEANSSISANGGNGVSHPDGSGAGGSGGAIRIEAGSIQNLGSLEARGGDAIIWQAWPEPVQVEESSF